MATTEASAFNEWASDPMEYIRTCLPDCPVDIRGTLVQSVENPDRFFEDYRVYGAIYTTTGVPGMGDGAKVLAISKVTTNRPPAAPPAYAPQGDDFAVMESAGPVVDASLEEEVEETTAALADVTLDEEGVWRKCSDSEVLHLVVLLLSRHWLGLTEFDAAVSLYAASPLTSEFTRLHDVVFSPFDVERRSGNDLVFRTPFIAPCGDWVSVDLKHVRDYVPCMFYARSHIDSMYAHAFVYGDAAYLGNGLIEKVV